MKRTRLALVTLTRNGFNQDFPVQAQTTMPAALAEVGCDVIAMPSDSTPFGGAIMTRQQGADCNRWLMKHRDEYDGIWVTLANFGDEVAVPIALKDVKVPVFIHAMPDDPSNMTMACRTDATCGKFNVTAALLKNEIGFVIDDPFAVAPGSDEFAKNVAYFTAVCRTYNRLKTLRIGAIGALTTPFKDLQCDLKTLAGVGIDVESLDLSSVFALMRDFGLDSAEFKDRAEELQNYADFSRVPGNAFENLVRLSLALTKLIEEYALNAIAPRCWTEMESEYGIAPCVLLSWLNNTGIVAACEVDVMNAVVMSALTAASEGPATCLDWNNSWKTLEEIVVFHCGQTPRDLMRGCGVVQEHEILRTVTGTPGWGPCVGHIAQGPYTYGSAQTDDGNVYTYLGNGDITDEEVQDFFGCRGVLRVEKLQRILRWIAENGFEHHMSMTPGNVIRPVAKAMRMRRINVIDVREIKNDTEDDTD
jgi:L-fucose isomerase-like protein